MTFSPISVDFVESIFFVIFANKKDMPYNNYVITAPISISDVSLALGDASKDLGTLCKSKKINMWSLKKPVHILNCLFHARDAESKWWLGTDRKCGIDITDARCTLYTELPQLYTSDMKNGWKYQPPYGGASSPFRIQDFENYWGAAEPPLHDFTIDEKAAKGKMITASAKASLGMENSDGSGPGSVTLSDIQLPSEFEGGQETSLADYYFGIMIVDSNGVIRDRKATTRARGIPSCSYTVPDSFPIHATYTVYPFLSRETINGIADTSGGYEKSNVYYTLPNVAPASFTVVSLEDFAGLTISLRAFKLYDTYNKPYIRYELEVSTEEGKTVTILGGYIHAKYSQSEDLMVREYNVDMPKNRTITSTNPYTTSGTFSPLEQGAGYIVNLYLRTDKGIFQRSIIPLTENTGGDTVS